MSKEGSRGSDPFLGVVLDDRYEIVGRLGSGAMGTVYRAHQTKVGRDVAIKVLSEAISADESVTERFKNEWQIIAELRHPHTLKLIDVGTCPGGQLYIVTELLSGASLLKLMREKSLTPQRILRLMRQVCESLAEAHGKGIVHRDIKPANLFVETVGDQEIAKVLDFGIAKLSHQPGLTASGTVFGTPAYMSPEQARAQQVSAQSDVYSLGIVLYECFAGKPPFESPVPINVMLEHMSLAPMPLSKRVPPVDVPLELEELILSMLAKDPEGRPNGAMEVARRLETIERHYQRAQKFARRRSNEREAAMPELAVAGPAAKIADTSVNMRGPAVQASFFGRTRMRLLASLFLLAVSGAAFFVWWRSKQTIIEVQPAAVIAKEEAAVPVPVPVPPVPPVVLESPDAGVAKEPEVVVKRATKTKNLSSKPVASEPNPETVETPAFLKGMDIDIEEMKKTSKTKN
jgi:hypothetical protein